MTDYAQRSNSSDAQRINVNHEYELRYWSTQFGVTPERLREAVMDAGTSVEALRNHLRDDSLAN